MRALAVYGSEKMEMREAGRRAPGPREVVIAVGAVGLCGTDFHIYEGRANYHTDASGKPIPTSAELPAALILTAGRELIVAPSSC